MNTRYRCLNKLKLITLLIVGVLSVCLISILISFILTRISNKGIDSFNGVKVYSNGKDILTTHGISESKDGYIFGYKWQCPEFIVRYYYYAKNFKMNSTKGNAKDFYKVGIEDGELNSERGLIQYKNGSKISPKKEDIIVFSEGKYGHVAIVTKVEKNSIEVIQQNVYEKTREDIKLTIKDGKYTLGDGENILGWLRKE
ncbi:CHAP domain-containing protein [Clostridium sp. 'White wine YQ']|uniref:CHAP domain-containing protein n=1 Tax=Clostridium sp. 'White wine YQ' TaxID=3027474 RepID=UPI0023669243|nr:CHAP domain-containing protein [Clostridium sp. 'White wine YQ']MDD7795124.1 CHAP domain-containing protein [Clostridium sp. 'White wine YQ']